MKARIVLFVLQVLTAGVLAQNPADSTVYSLDGDLSELLGKTHGSRTPILTPFYEWGLRRLDSTTVYNRLHRIDSLARAHNDRDLELEVDLMDIHYYAYRNYFPSEVPINMLLELNEVAKKEGAVWLEIRCQSLLGNYYFNGLHEYEQGSEYFERVVVLLNDFTVDEFPLKMECLYQAGLAYYVFRDYENALGLFREAMQLYRPRENDYYLIQGLNTLALTHQRLGQLDSAAHYFERLHQYAIETDNMAWQGITDGNLGRLYVEQGRIDEAIPLFEHEVEVATVQESWVNAGAAYTDLGEIWLERGQFDDAREAGRLATEYIFRSGDYGNKGNLYKLLAKLAALDNEPQRSARYVDSAMAVSDSLERKWSSLKLMRARQRVSMEQRKAAVEAERQAKAREVLIRNVIIGALVLLLIIGLLIYRTARLRSKAKAQELAAQKQAALAELEHFKTSIIEKNELIEDIRANLDSLHAQVHAGSGSGAPVDPTADNMAIQQLVQSTLLTEDGWRDFAILFEQVYTGFFDRLKQRWPNLTPAETRFLALSRLKLQNREMASMLGVGTDAIRQVKSRLKKKIGLDAADSFEALAETI